MMDVPWLRTEPRLLLPQKLVHEFANMKLDNIPSLLGSVAAGHALVLPR